MNFSKTKYKALIVLAFSVSTIGNAQITWPEGQLLPSFPPSAQTQDLIYLNGSTPVYAKSWIWQAESDFLTHATGRLDGDGWICEEGIHAPNQFMVYGPYDKNVTSGPNFADFRMMIDNNSLNDDSVVNLDVRNATTGLILASKRLTRKQFTSAGTYVNFRLDFQMPADSQSVELRVFWRGIAKVKVDYVQVKQNNADAELYLFSSLKGLINRKQPRIFSYEGDAFAEGPYTWLSSLGMQYIENKANNLNILSKYLSDVSGLIVYDPTQIHTVNLAAVLAGRKNALVASPSFVSLLTNAPYNLPVLEDLRGKFSNKMQIYQTLFDDYWSSIDHRLLIGLNPIYHKASLREYAIALGAAVVWLDPKIAEERTLLNKFFASMPIGANYMGWWPEEAPGVMRGSEYGISTIASDYCTNLTFHSGMSRKIDIKPIPVKPILQNKIYVAFILSDGDNLQFVEHLLRKLWSNPDRGSVPIGWTMSPAMVDAMPGALNYFHKSSSDNDNLISGPSGYGYTYPNYWTSLDALNQFAVKTEEYNLKAGFRVITIWNTITGGITRNTGLAFATNSPTLLGLTAQNTGGALSIYNSTLPGMPLSCNYCTNEQAMKDHIASASANWTGTSPRFVIIQAQPWNGVNPTSFKNVMNSLNANYQVVRPDHLFQLMREANNLPVNPGAVEGQGEGLTGTYFNGMNFETQVAERIDSQVNFDWGANSPIDEVNPNVFSVRWTGQVQPRYTGTYTFYTTADNGCRVWVNNQLLIDKWDGFPGTTYTGTIPLVAGEKYDIKIEYYENANLANCKLEWASSLQSREVIPQSQLFKSISSGVNEVVETSGFKIFPNPVSNGILNVEMDALDSSGANFTIFDICGNKLMTNRIINNTQKIDINKLPKGIYLFQVNYKSSSKSIKYIVN